MTLEEAIAHCEEMVCESACGQEHKQLAEWLRELRDRRSFARKAKELSLAEQPLPIDLVLKIGRDFQYSDRNFRGATFDTAKLLCDTIERLAKGKR